MKKTTLKTPSPRKYNAATERTANAVGSRIAAARKSRGLSIASFTDVLNDYGISLTKAAVGKWETGETVPSVYQFLAVCSALDMDDRLSAYKNDFVPELNEEGLRKVDQYKHDLISSGNYRPAQKILQFIRTVEMPVADLPAAAGTGNYLDESEHCEMISFPEDRVSPRADIGIRVSGDSMEPVYHDGQIVWVEKCQELHPGETGIFLYDGKAYIKVYGEQEPDEAVRESYTDSYGTVHSQPVLFSYNEKYDPIVISPYSPFRVYGRVLG